MPYYTQFNNGYDFKAYNSSNQVEMTLKINKGFELGTMIRD